MTLQTLQIKLGAEMNREHHTLPCAFVIFRTLRMATTAVQVGWDNSPLGMNMAPAPEVSNVLWNNLPRGLWRRYCVQCTPLHTWGGCHPNPSLPPRSTKILVQYFLVSVVFCSCLFVLYASIVNFSENWVLHV